MITTESNVFKLAEIEVKYSTKIKAADRPKVSTSHDAADAFRELWSQSMEHKESFYAMYLNRNNRILGIHKVAEGGLSGTVVDIRCVFQVALKANACSVIVAHNHPSGNSIPSEADKTITRKIKEAGKFLDIPLLDHLIMLPDEGYTSFADEGFI
ncbi:MAG: JAB domain-containing protein [Prolixibacteraceae bacterium]